MKQFQVFFLPTPSTSESALGAALKLLDGEARHRVSSLLSERDRIDFICAHALKVVLLADALGVRPNELEFAKDSNGKPSVQLKGRSKQIPFSMTHTSGMVGLAIHPHARSRLGIDIEHCGRPVRASLFANALGASELDWIGSLPESHRGAAFLRIWTLKEALGKATGAGIIQDLRSFFFIELESLDQPKIRFLDHPLELTTEEWSFETNYLPGGFVASVAWQIPGTLAALSSRPSWVALELRDLLRKTRR